MDQEVRRKVPVAVERDVGHIVDQELIDGFFKRYFPFEFLREPVDEQVFPVGFGPCVGDARFYQLAELFVSLRAVVRRGAEVFEPDEGPAIPV